MKATSNIVRVLFLVVAFFSSTSTTQAVYWQYSCNSYCNGFVQVHECAFADLDYSGGSTCGEAEAIFGEYGGGLCEEWARLAGGYPWFTLTSCYDDDGTADGTFYCSYDSYYCP